MNKMTALMGVGLACLVTSVLAETSQPFQASLVPDVAMYDRGQRIEGVALSVWGENPQSALAIGFVNGSTGESSGLSWGFIANYADTYSGVQLGFVNLAKEKMNGFQWGCVNYAKSLSGLQLGFVNYAEQAESGVQVGLVNIMPENKVWFSNLPNEVAPAMIFVNWNF